MAGNLKPLVDDLTSLGATGLRWLKGWFHHIHTTDLTNGTDTATVANLKLAVDAKHARQHALTSGDDHTGIVTSVTSGSTDAQVATAKAVWDLLSGITGGLSFKGTWNATTNSPALASGTGANGDFYKVATAGTTTLDGISEWAIGDWVIFCTSVWMKIDQTEQVLSVNSQTGAVVLDADDVGAELAGAVAAHEAGYDHNQIKYLMAPLASPVDTPPATPTVGFPYLIGPTGSGAWAGEYGIAICTHGSPGVTWSFYHPAARLLVRCSNPPDTFFTWAGSSWRTLTVDDTLLYFNDTTIGDASIYRHGLLPKLEGSTTKYLRADGTWQTISGGGYTNLTSFVAQTAWRLFYSDGSGHVQELALGDAGKVLQANGASAAPTWETAGGGSSDATWEFSPAARRLPALGAALTDTTMRTRRCGKISTAAAPYMAITAYGRVWAVLTDNTVRSYDIKTGAQLSSVAVTSYGRLTAGFGSVWLNNDAKIYRINTSTGAITATITSTFAHLATAPVKCGSYMWAAGCAAADGAGDVYLHKINPADNTVTRQVVFSAWMGSLAATITTDGEHLYISFMHGYYGNTPYMYIYDATGAAQTSGATAAPCDNIMQFAGNLIVGKDGSGVLHFYDIDAGAEIGSNNTQVATDLVVGGNGKLYITTGSNTLWEYDLAGMWYPSWSGSSLPGTASCMSADGECLLVPDGTNSKIYTRMIG